MKCKKCGLKISENRFIKTSHRIDGNDYCMKCIETCKTCRKTVIKGSVILKKYLGEAYCNKCYSNIPGETCFGCRIKIEDKYYTIEKRIYCLKCIESEKCSLCGLPIGRNISYLPDKRKICFACSKPPAIDITRAEQYLREVIIDVKAFCGLELPETKIELLSHTELQERCNWNTLEAAGIYSGGTNAAILIVPSYTEEYFKTVLCHESVHAWQEANWKKQYNMDTREGMARYIELLYTKNKGYKEEEDSILRHIKLKPGSHYTTGLQYFLEMEKEKGREFVMTHFRSL